jgi:hypothetical protein
MKLIEKIVEKFLNDGDYAVGLMVFSFMTMFLLSAFSMNSYLYKLDTEVQLAKIAAGQFECEPKVECKCK